MQEILEIPASTSEYHKAPPQCLSLACHAIMGIGKRLPSASRQAVVQNRAAEGIGA